VLQRELHQGGDAPKQRQQLVKPWLQPVAMAKPAHLPQKQEISVRLRDPLPPAKVDGNGALGLPGSLAARNQQPLASRVRDNFDPSSEGSGEQIPQALSFFFLKGFQRLEVWATSHTYVC
jgi:hypothetical protein